ncbi:poly(ADP-ribose) glycohydrolase 1-like isoform X2 [Nymphaea colorata]|uniref:poly(ADP-ribose) glycohydrolase 1-like isoform X2 n=1 Tax=Nymphaea colorata TaxID=210225 RepID=UPI00214EFA68|nr:poly(ADP-ribose) glycohydrolase 1-like isoform X2 [Nymphaea colorata]
MSSVCVMPNRKYFYRYNKSVLRVYKTIYILFFSFHFKNSFHFHSSQASDPFVCFRFSPFFFHSPSLSFVFISCPFPSFKRCDFVARRGLPSPFNCCCVEEAYFNIFVFSSPTCYRVQRGMEKREDLNSILPFLPLTLRCSSLCWPPLALEALKVLSRGPAQSKVDSGDVLFDAIVDLRHHLGLSGESLSWAAGKGYTRFFSVLISPGESKRWFEEFIPSLACMLLRLPSLLEAHYEEEDDSDSLLRTRLRLLDSQEAGAIFLSQELIGALLSCSFFCLFPCGIRDVSCLPIINFDYLFAGIGHGSSQSQENKIKCLVHYFERICTTRPLGFVSFERKILSLNNNPLSVSYPGATSWVKSTISLCPIEVLQTGKIEDQQHEALEVDFANKFIGGGALTRGCVQEEIRFMINPELIVGMLFLPSMADNEAVEIVGAERFSSYTGYASSFLFSGDYLDQKAKDAHGRRRTQIVAIDALSRPGAKQYNIKYLLRETNKAFCGFMDQSKCQEYHGYFNEGSDKSDVGGNGVAFDVKHAPFDEDDSSSARLDLTFSDTTPLSTLCIETNSKVLACSVSTKAFSEKEQDKISHGGESESSQVSHGKESIGIATGNWGCGAFGGDPELKCMIQWLAASQKAL